MRIISGEFKSRKIKTADLDLLRPATDRYRETLFNILNNYVDFNDLVVCDIYAGTGAIGFECISRGAKLAYFIENNFKTVKLIKENIELLKIKEKTNVVKGSADLFTSRKSIGFDLIFADPPYPDLSYEKVFINIKKNELLNDDGLLIIQRSKKTIKEDSKILKTEPFKIIGDDIIYFFSKENL